MHSIFIAFPLPKTVKDQLARLCFGLPQVHWTEHNDFHLTIHFVGPVNALTRLDIQDALNQIRFPPFRISLEGVGYFDNKSNGVVWAGVSPSKELDAIKKIIVTQLKKILTVVDKKPFVPHITLGRFKTIDKRRLADYLDSHSLFATVPFGNDFLVLMESQKTAAESTIYQELARFKLIPPINKLRILND